MYNNSNNISNSDKYILDFNDQELSREELVNTFEILHKKGLINRSELQRAITVANNNYKSMRQIMEESITKSDIK